jgi:hypothetical protein
MGLARSTFYAELQVQPIDEARLVEQIKAVCAEWPAYGYRRVTAELHGEGRIVNHKKVMRDRARPGYSSAVIENPEMEPRGSLSASIRATNSIW